MIHAFDLLGHNKYPCSPDRALCMAATTTAFEPADGSISAVSRPHFSLCLMYSPAKLQIGLVLWHADNVCVQQQVDVPTAGLHRKKLLPPTVLASDRAHHSTTCRLLYRICTMNLAYCFLVQATKWSVCACACCLAGLAAFNRFDSAG